MINLTQYIGKKIGVFGLGISGQATITALTSGGAEVYAWDDKAESVTKAQEVCPQAKFKNFAGWPWKQMEMLVLAPGVPLKFPEPHMVVQVASIHGCRIVGDIELLAETCPKATYIGITGTNGKSTTTALVGHILKTAGMRCEVGGNLGTSALSLMPLGEGGVYVLELSSYQIDLLSSAVFNIAVLLNITPDHLDRHGGMEGYIAAKRQIFNGQRAGDTAIIGVDTEPCKAIMQDLKSGKSRFTWQGAGSKVVPISTKKALNDGVYALKGVLHAGDQKMDISQAPALVGEHNWENAAAAYAVARALGIADDKIKRGIDTFAGLAHRMKLVDIIGKVKFVNDSKATNAEAAEKALRSYENIYWILGGKAKEGGIASLTEYFSRIKQAYLIGEAAESFAEVLKQNNVSFQHCGSLENATKAASRDALGTGSGVVLLSPACASFDQFRSFEHRGDVFAELVKELIAKGKQGNTHGQVGSQ